MTLTKRAAGATIATAVASTMLVNAPVAHAEDYNGKRQATVTLRIPAGVTINSRSAVVVRLSSEAGKPNGLVSLSLRRYNGKVIQRKTCRTGRNSVCRVVFKTPRRGRGGYIVVRYFGNKLYDGEQTARIFKYKRR